MGRVRGLAAVVALALLAAACGDGSATKRTIPTPPGPSTYSVATMTQTFVDTRRGTLANGGEPSKPTRTLATTILYPTPSTGGPFPLIVFAHGFGSRPASYDSLLQSWASTGYVVAAPAFPLSNSDAPGGASQNDIVNQPGDISFVINQMVRLNGEMGPLKGLIDPNRIGAAGHSAGAVTIMGAALDSCCRDDRIGAAAIMSGFEGAFPNGAYHTASTPVLFLHGDHDEAIPFGQGQQAYLDALPPKFFVALLGADHSGPFSTGPSTPATQVVERSTLDFFDHYLKGRADALTRLAQDGAVSGVSTIETVGK